MSPGKMEQDAKGNPQDLHASTGDVRAVEAAVKVLETHREIMAASAEQMRKDVQDARDRLIRVEMKVDSLPTKDWIAASVSGAVRLTATVVGMIAALVGIAITLVHNWH